MHDPTLPWFNLRAIQAAVAAGNRRVGSLAQQQIWKRQYDAALVWECVCALTDDCFYRSGVTRHTDFPGELFDAYKDDFCGRKTWFKLALLEHGVVKLISVHPTE